MIWLIYVALTIANFYFLDWTHFGFNASLAAILGLVFLSQTVRNMYRQIRASMIPSLFINYFMATLLTSGFVFYLVMIHNTAIFTIIDGFNFRDTRAQEYSHSLFVDSTWQNHFVRPFPIVNELVRTKLAGRRLWFLPYASGYYYYNDLDNPTSFDLMPLNHLTAVDEQRLRDELSASVDAVVFLPATWKKFDQTGSIMTWIRGVFPYRQDFSNGEIRVFSRQPL